MSSQAAVEWQQIEDILGNQPGAQVHFAQYIVNLGPVQGSVISLAPGAQQAVDELRPRMTARQFLPGRVAAGFVDRAREQSLIGEALARGQVVDVHGPPGTGKTSLLSHVMHLQHPGNRPAGMVYLTLRHDHVEDVLQELAEHFYEAAGRRVKVTENEVRRLMAGKRALIVLDEANHLDTGGAEAIARAMPQAAFVVAGREPQLLQGEAVALGGLPLEEAVTLFERHLGHALGDQRPVAEAICGALGGVPLPIVKAARVAGVRRVRLTQVLEEVQPQASGPEPVEQLFWMLAHHLSAREGLVLAALAASGGPSVGRTAVAHISGLPPAETEEVISGLQELGLVHVAGTRCSLDDGLRLYLAQHGVEEELRARAAAYYLHQAGTLRVRFRHPDEENVIAALVYYRERGRWREVLSIVRHLEMYLITSGRWGQWRTRLEDAWRASRELRDPRTEAWAQNQLGILALASCNQRRAAKLFRGALRLWRTIGDENGANIARWNLRVVLDLPSPPADKEPEPAAAGGRRARLPAIMAGIAAILLTILVALAWLVSSRAVASVSASPMTTIVLSGSDVDGPPDSQVSPLATMPSPPAIATRDDDSPSDIATSPLATAPVELAIATPDGAPAISPLPTSIDLWLVEGCDRAYTPGEQVEVRAQTNVAGILTIYARAPGNERHGLLRVELPARGVTRGRYNIPEREGDWRLEAELDRGRATAVCAFAVALEPEPAPPRIEGVDILPVAGETVCPGDAVWIVADISHDDVLRAVTITTRPPGGRASRAEMVLIDDLTYASQVTAYEKPGLAFFIEAEDVDGRRSRTREMWYTVKPCT